MKFKTTKKAIMENYYNVIKVGYCNLQTLLNYKSPIAYTTRREGWGCDIYEITPNTCISTGYAPFGNIHPDYELQREYEMKARDMLNDYSIPYQERINKLNELIKEFVKKVTEK